jgi:beta-1,4-N-acetylglucosaminyltransferase
MRILYMKKGYKLAIPKRWSKASSTSLASSTPSANFLDDLPAAYFLYVLGSGGHTAEMFELLRVTASPARNVHRRYVFTTGDNNSLNAIINFETRVRELFGNNGGTWDAYQVKRARNVHQPLYTAWFTSLLSLMSIFEALTTPPDERNTPQDLKFFKYPLVIITNGPGNGVMTALIARLLKIFFFAPNNCMKVIFIETWAHVYTLSLTGKIFHWGRHIGGIVDVFLVQHRPLAEKYGYKEFDFITPTARRPTEGRNHG